MTRRKTAVAWTILLYYVLIGTGHAGPRPTKAKLDLSQLQALASALASRLGLHQSVRVVVVEKNEFVISVEPIPGEDETYRLLVERAFLDALDDDDTAAAIAHELGHVWLFTHHPYLHTETLANDIAMRIVPRHQLEDLYSKLWKYTGVAGSIANVLGAAPVDPSAQLVKGDH